MIRSTEYGMYSQADNDFFETPALLKDADTRYDTASRPAPDGWRRSEAGIWVGLAADAVDLPAQGWKVHVSATEKAAGTTVDLVWEHCVAELLPFKFVRSATAYRLLNLKYANRASSGKLVTIYPRDEVQLQKCLDSLAELLADVQGPYILSDLRWAAAPVFTRYGGFVHRDCYGPDGDTVPAIEDATGTLVPDLRLPYFEIPDGVPAPAFVEDMIADTQSEEPSIAYDVEEALHFSNAGGVYLAVDSRSGRRVVLKEARPHAGLDLHGTDAVARLRREFESLVRLEPTGLVPRAIEYLIWGEHHFIVMEHIEGSELATELAEQYLGGPVPQYTAWALGRLAEIEGMLETVHARGVVVGDIHPGNFIVRPDGTLALVDFEVSAEVGAEERPGVGAPGFTPPPHLRGTSGDWHAYGRLMLFFFVQPVALLDRFPEKLDELLDHALRRFPLPHWYAPKVRRLLAGDGRRTTPVAAGTDLADVEASIVRGILADATPAREDRLYPGDPMQFHYGALGLAYGAAGVLHALHTAGVDPPDEHVEWLIRQARSADAKRTGLFDGLHGVAWTLRRLGRVRESDELVDRLLHGDRSPRADLFGGAAGAVLSLLDCAAATGSTAAADAALDQGTRLVTMRGLTAPTVPGLMSGRTGIGLAWIRLFEHTGDTSWLDAASAALRADLATCHRSPYGALQPSDGSRIQPYLADGSAGIALVIDRYLRHRDDEELRAARSGLLIACDTGLRPLCGLFNGLTGILAYRALSGSLDPEALLRPLVYAVGHRGNLAFHGDQLVRLSMDLASGAAGVLAYLRAAKGEEAEILPLVLRVPKRRTTDGGDTHDTSPEVAGAQGEQGQGVH